MGLQIYLDGLTEKEVFAHSVARAYAILGIDPVELDRKAEERRRAEAETAKAEAEAKKAETERKFREALAKAKEIVKRPGDIVFGKHHLISVDGFCFDVDILRA